MLKLDLEAAVEDASDEVYSFQIPKSLIYWKLVGLYISRSQYYISESPQKSTFDSESHRTQPCLGSLSGTFLTIFNSGYIL